MKEKKNLRNKWLHLRLDEAEYSNLVKQFKGTTEAYLSKYARNILLGKPMIKAVRNESLKEVIVILSQLQKDLNGLTNNYNQMVHKLHTLDKIPQVTMWLTDFNAEREKLFENVEVVRDYISKTAEKWLL